MANGSESRPTRLCLNSTGPRESSLMAMAATSSTGEAMTSPAVAPMMSKPRFAIRRQPSRCTGST